MLSTRVGGGGGLGWGVGVDGGVPMLHVDYKKWLNVALLHMQCNKGRGCEVLRENVYVINGLPPTGLVEY